MSHTTGTLHGPVTLVLNGTTYVGRFTVWFGGNTNLNNAINVVTFNAKVTADGTVLSDHQLVQLNSSTSEPSHVVDVFRATCNCS